MKTYKDYEGKPSEDFYRDVIKDIRCLWFWIAALSFAIFVLMWIPKASAQAVAVSEGKMFDNVAVANGASVTYAGAAKFTTGYSFNLNITCPVAPCNGLVEVLGSNDNITFEVIPQLSQSYSAAINFVYNIFNIKFLYLNVKVSNQGPNDQSIYGYWATKSQI